MDKPDVVFCKPSYDSWDAYGHWYGDSKGGGTRYLLATPERELASELVEALKQIASFETLMPDGERPVVTPEAALARAVLAKLEGKG